MSHRSWKRGIRYSTTEDNKFRYTVYTRRKPSAKDATLIALFPYRMYWRDLSSILRKHHDVVVSTRNAEGEVYPSFSNYVHTTEFEATVSAPRPPTEEEAEKLDRDDMMAVDIEINRLFAYVSCPHDGKQIWYVVSGKDSEETVGEKVTIFVWGNKIPFPKETVFEAANMLAARNLAYRVLGHIRKHGKTVEKGMKAPVLVVRHVFGKDVVIPAEITSYYYEGKRTIGTTGVLYHFAEEADKDIIDHVENVLQKAENALAVVGMEKEDVPVITAHRTRFSINLVEGEKKGKYKILSRHWVTTWLRLEAVRYEGGAVEMRAWMQVPRPERIVYQYPPLRYIPFIVAYKIAPHYYHRFIRSVRGNLKYMGYDTTKLDMFNELIVGGTVYSLIDKELVPVDINKVESALDAVIDLKGDAKYLV